MEDGHCFPLTVTGAKSFESLSQRCSKIFNTNLRKIIEDLVKQQDGDEDLQTSPWLDPRLIQLKDWLHTNIPIFMLISMFKSIFKSALENGNYN